MTQPATTAALTDPQQIRTMAHGIGAGGEAVMHNIDSMESLAGHVSPYGSVRVDCQRPSDMATGAGWSAGGDPFEIGTVAVDVGAS